MKVSAKLTAVISLLWNSSQLSKAQELCSCSPRKYSFTLSLSQTCNDDTLQSSPGVFTTVCSTDTNVEVDGDWSDLIPDVGGSLVRRSLNLNDKPVLRLAEDVVPIKIVSIVFAEVNSDGSLVIINKDESFADADLGNGAIVEFDSISNTLDSNVVLQDQSDVPGGVTVLLVGENADGKLVKTRMLWLYKNDCDLVPLAETSDLGWISVTTLEKATTDFCVAADESSLPAIHKDSAVNFSVKSKAGKSEITELFPKSSKSIAADPSTSQENGLFTKSGKVFAKSGKAGVVGIVTIKPGNDADIVMEENTTNYKSISLSMRTSAKGKKHITGSKSRK